MYIPNHVTHLFVLERRYTTFGNVNCEAELILNVQYIEMAVGFRKPFFQNRLDGLNALRYKTFATSFNNQSSYGMWNNNRWNVVRQQQQQQQHTDPLHPRKLSEALTKAGVIKLFFLEFITKF